MYIYGFTSVTSTVHIVAAHPKKVIGAVILILASVLAVHHHKPTPQQAPAAQPAVSATAPASTSTQK